MNASEIISKKVYSIEEGCEVGYVLNFSIDKAMSKLEFLTIVSLQEENEFVLKTEDVSSLTESAVFINCSKLLNFDANAEANNPIGKKIFSVEGNVLGRVEDVELDKYKVKKIIGSACEILPKHVYSCGRDCIFFSKKKAKKSNISLKKCEIDVKIQEISLPYREKSGGINLIGKTLLRDVLDKNSIIVFRKNLKVTPKILIEAKQKGLLKKLGESLI